MGEFSFENIVFVFLGPVLELFVILLGARNHNREQWLPLECVTNDLFVVFVPEKEVEQKRSNNLPLCNK